MILLRPENVSESEKKKNYFRVSMKQNLKESNVALQKTTKIFEVFNEIIDKVKMSLSGRLTKIFTIGEGDGF